MHQMKLIGLMTKDPRTYFETLKVLREEGLEFISLDFSEKPPANVAVIITTEKEREKVHFDRVITDHEPGAAVARARLMVRTEGAVKDIVIGIDPGVRPGVAVLGDGAVLMRSLANTPESVGGMVEDVLREYPAAKVVVRIGNGDRTNRNRIFNKLWDEGLRLEIVDESNTTTESRTPDEDAAVEIAMTPGYRPGKKQETNPCLGEIRNIQRISRLESGGSLTVTRELARKVALGDLTLAQAIEQMKSNGGDR